MEFCKHCQSPLLEGSKFCSKCGTPAPQAPAAPRCEKCGMELKTNTRFCTNCGTPVGGGSAPQRPQQPRPVTTQPPRMVNPQQPWSVNPQQPRPVNPQPHPVNPQPGYMPPVSMQPVQKKKSALPVVLIACLSLVLLLAAGIGIYWALGNWSDVPSSSIRNEREDDAEEIRPSQAEPMWEETAPVATMEPVEIAYVELTVWAPETNAELIYLMAEEFAATYGDQVDFSIYVEYIHEGDAGPLAAADPYGAADIFTFASDQTWSLVQAGALAPITEEMGSREIIARNVASAVNAASIDGTLYAYPMTADNGYFMYYDKTVFTEADLQSWDTMLAAAQRAGRKIYMEENGWYLYSFYQGAGLNVTMNPDGTNECDWAGDTGVAVSQSIMNIAKHPAFISGQADTFRAGLYDGTVCAGISGTWMEQSVREAWGSNYGACKLPTFTLNGRQVQMGGFMGGKLVGVNATSENAYWAMKFADWITNERNQQLRFETLYWGPSNIAAAASPAVQSSPAMAAIAEQAKYSERQLIGPRYWTPAETLARMLMTENYTQAELLGLLTEIEAMIEEG